MTDLKSVNPELTTSTSEAPLVVRVVRGRQQDRSEVPIVDRLLRRRPRWLPYALVIAVLGVGLGLMIMGFVWWYVIAGVWNSWVAGPLTDDAPRWELLKIIPGFIGIFFLFALSVWLPGLPIVLIGRILRVYLDSADEQVAQKVEEISRDQSEAEKELEESDSVGLVPLVRYSRKQLEAYYTIGLNQTQRSFRYSVVAMWLGFFVILSGIIYQILPLEQIFPEKWHTKERRNQSCSACRGNSS